MRSLHGSGGWRRRRRRTPKQTRQGPLSFAVHFARPEFPDLCEAENFAGENEWGWEAETEAILETETEADL